MTAKWKWGSINIYVSEEEITREIKRAELFVLGATESVWHTFGAGSEHRSVKGIVIGESDRNSILSDAIGDTSRTLTTPWGNMTSAKINGTPKFTAVKYNGGDIDGVSYTVDVTPIYECDLEVIQT